MTERTTMTRTMLRRALPALLFATLLPQLAIAASALNPEWAEMFGVDMNASYDGKRKMTMEGTEMTVIERRAPGKMYTEMEMGGMTAAVILREDLGTSYMLMPTMKMYREMNLQEAIAQTNEDVKFSQAEKVGKEDVNGHPSTKWKAAFESPDGKGEGFMWVTDTGVPIKMDLVFTSPGQAGQRILTEMTELNLREQDPKVFDIPPGYNPMNFGGLKIPGMPGQKDGN